MISIANKEIIMSSSMFTLTPVTADRRFFTAYPDHVLIGLSPWNGRYKPRYIEALVSWAYANFPHVDVLVPGYEAAHTLIAAGMNTAEAVHRARGTVNQLRNPALRALCDAGVPDPARHVHTWTQLHARPAYVAWLRRVQHAYVTDPAVRQVCRATARAAVQHQAEDVPSDKQIDLAVGYSLAELPLVLGGPSIFTVSSSLFLYHREMELVEPFISGASTTLAPEEGQGYAIVAWGEPGDDCQETEPTAEVSVPIG